ncbi:MAG: glycosyltransferase [Candidatus Aminicenantes bacterium]|nr:glycosyltransferase [Candidatus Aminicenantes bacterium]
MKTAVLIPCLNEEQTIGKVVADFKRVLPSAQIYVYDNDSSDRTATVAAAAGATVGKELRRGKGNQVRTMFREIDADIYLLVDGDDTYPAEAAPELLLAICQSEADMIIGDRQSSGAYCLQNKRLFHNFGNGLITMLTNLLFRSNLHDVLSGMRVLSRRFVQNCVINGSGFTVETELTLQALGRHFSVKEIPIAYFARPPGSHSKLRTLTDGACIIKTIFSLFKHYRPIAFFSAISILTFAVGLAIGFPFIKEIVFGSSIFHLSGAILTIGLVGLSVIALIYGMIQNANVRQHKKNCRLQLRQSDKRLPKAGD